MLRTVFYKNQFAMSTTILNIYMIFGGTNWGASFCLICSERDLHSYGFPGGIAHPGFPFLCLLYLLSTT
jgi:hypothetical protein